MALYAISGFVCWEQALPLPLLLWLSACTIPHKVKGSIKAVVVYGGGDLVVDYLKFQIMRYSKIPLFLNTSGFAFSYLLFDKFNPNVKCILDFESLFVVSLIYKFYIDWNKMNLTYISSKYLEYVTMQIHKSWLSLSWFSFESESSNKPQ